MTQCDRSRFATMFAANTQLDIGTNFTAIIDGDSYQPSDASRVEHLEGVVRKDTTVDIRR